MTPKSLVYMVVAVFVGYMLVSTVPGQVAMYVVPSLSVEKGDTITLTGTGFSPDNESSSVEGNGSVVIYWDSVNSTEGTHGIWVDNETISFDVEGSNESIAGSLVIVEGRGFSPDNESISSEIDELSEFGEESDAISEVESIADLAVEAEQAAEAVAATASTASDAAADAAEAANAAKSARSGLEFMGTMVWLSVDVLVALVVYWFAKRRFA